MNFLNIFKGMFRRTTGRYEMRAKAKVRANTLGKAQAKMMKAQAKMDEKVNRGMDKVGPGKKGKKGPPGRAPVGPGQAQGGAGRRHAVRPGARPAHAVGRRGDGFPRS